MNDTTSENLSKWIDDNYIKILNASKKIFKRDYSDHLNETILIVYSMDENLLNHLISNNQLLFYIVRIFKNRRSISNKNHNFLFKNKEEDFYNIFEDAGILGSIDYELEEEEEYECRIEIEKKEEILYNKIINIIKKYCSKVDGKIFLDKTMKYSDLRMSNFVRLRLPYDKNDKYGYINAYQNTMNSYNRVLKIIKEKYENR